MPPSRENKTSAWATRPASNRTGLTDPEGGATAFVYDTLNRLQTLTPPSAFGSGSFGFGYDALSRRTQLTRPNNANTTYAYDSLSHLLSASHVSGRTTIDGASYTVDAAGNRTSRTPLPSGTATNYAYDAIYELLSATQCSTTKASYSYDIVGNRLTSLGMPSYVYNNSNELTASSVSTFTFDNDGNTLTIRLADASTSPPPAAPASSPTTATTLWRRQIPQAQPSRAIRKHITSISHWPSFAAARQPTIMPMALARFRP